MHRAPRPPAGEDAGRGQWEHPRLSREEGSRTVTTLRALQARLGLLPTDQLPLRARCHLLLRLPQA